VRFADDDAAPLLAMHLKRVEDLLLRGQKRPGAVAERVWRAKEGEYNVAGDPIGIYDFREVAGLSS
jgi:hypothetical protein